MFSLLRILFSEKKPLVHVMPSREEFYKDVDKKRVELGLPVFEAPKDPS